MNLNESYQKYHDNPAPKNYEGFGEALQSFVRATVANNFGSRFHGLQDAIGEAMCKILEGLPNFDPQKGSFLNWAYTVTYNTCIDALRLSTSHKEQGLIEVDGYTSGVNSIDRILLESLLDKLTPEERRLVELKMACESNEEVASSLGIEMDALKKRWTRVLGKLRELGGQNGRSF